jgi:hypothetical protein
VTVSSTTNKHYYNGTGSQTSFPYTFKVFANTDLAVYVGGVLKAVDTDFTVSDVGVDSGGNIVFSVAPIVGTGNVTIVRKLALSQSVDLVQYGKFDAEVIEAQYDKIVMMVQQIQEQADRSIRFSATVSDAGAGEITDSITERSGKVLAYDASGDLSVATELGDWEGNWTTTTVYAVRDLVMDSATNNVYTCLVGHTAGTLATDVSAGKWALVVDASAVAASASTATTKASEASASASTASTHATTATTKASEAASSASTASTQASTATTKASEASTSASTASTQAGIATTQAGIATTKASEAAASAAGVGIASGITIDDANLVVNDTTNLQTFLEGVDHSILKDRGTGVASSYVSSVAVGGTTFAQPTVDGEINSDQGYFHVTYAGATGITVANTSAASTYVYIDNANALQQQTTIPTRQDWSRKMFVMRIAVDLSSNTIIGFEYLNNPIGNFANSLRDIYKYLLLQGVPFKDGQTITGRSSDLGFDIAAGSFMEFGGTGDINNANIISLSAVANADFYIATRTAQDSGGNTNLPKFWDNAGTLTPLGSTTVVGHRFYRFSNGNIVMQYGQGNYANMVLARAGVVLEDYVLKPSLKNATFLGWWLIESTATNTSGTTLTDFKEYTLGIAGGSSSGLTGAVLRGNNLSDLDDVAISKTNLGLGTVDSPTFANITTTGIDDNATSTAITLDSSGNAGFGTSSPRESLSVADSIISGGLSDSTKFVYRLEPTDTNFTRQLTISDRAGATAGVGKGNALIFASKYTGDVQQGMAGIVGISESITGTQAGALAFLTRAHDENPNEKMRIDSAGNAGFGVVPATKIHAQGLDNTVLSDTALTGGGGVILQVENTSTVTGSYAGLKFRTASGDVGIAAAYNGAANKADLVFLTDEDGGHERMRIDSAGNVGFGTSTPEKKLHVSDSTGTNLFRLTGLNGYQMDIESTGAGNQFDFNIASSGGSYTFNNSGGELVKIDNSGNVGFGITGHQASASSGNGGAWIGSPTGIHVIAKNGGVVQYLNRIGTDGTITEFRKNGSTVGSISVTGSSTSYNTSSDYRLKENVTPMTGATGRFKLLKPCNFDWIAGGNVDGFLSHELAEVVPAASTGTKDAMMDEEYEVSAATGDVFTAGVEGVTAVYETVTVSAAIEAQDAVMSERNVTETVETGSYVNLAGETIVETQEQTVTTEVVETVVQRQDIDGVSTEVEVEVTKQVPVTESYESTPALVAVDEVTEQSLVSEGVTAIAEVIHSADVEQPETLEEGQQWRETTAQVMATRSVPDMQGIDQSKLVPLLTATIQELIARIEVLEA